MNSRQRKKAHKVAARVWRDIAIGLGEELEWSKVALCAARLEAAKRHTFDLVFRMEDPYSVGYLGPDLTMTTPIDRDELGGWIRKYSGSYRDAIVSCYSKVKGQDDLCLKMHFRLEDCYIDLAIKDFCRRLVVGLMERVVNGE